MIPGRMASRRRARSAALLALLPIAALQGRATAAEGVAAALPPFRYVPQTLTDADRRVIALLYERTCSSCHGTDGGGNGNALALYGAKNPLNAAAAIHFGRAEPPPGRSIMPPYGALLTPIEIGQLVAYIASFRPPWP